MKQIFLTSLFLLLGLYSFLYACNPNDPACVPQYVNKGRINHIRYSSYSGDVSVTTAFFTVTSSNHQFGFFTNSAKGKQMLALLLYAQSNNIEIEFTALLPHWWLEYQIGAPTVYAHNVEDIKLMLP